MIGQSCGTRWTRASTRAVQALLLSVSLVGRAHAGGGNNRPVLRLEGGTPLLWASNLVRAGHRQYWVYEDARHRAWLASNARGRWANYALGTGRLFQKGGGKPLLGIAVHAGVVYVPYIAGDGRLRVAYHPARNPAGPWAQVTVVTPDPQASAGLGTETENPSAAVFGDQLAVAFDDAGGMSGTDPHPTDVYLATHALAGLGRGAWHIGNLTGDPSSPGYIAAARGTGYAPFIASVGTSLHLAWQSPVSVLQLLDGAGADLARVGGTPVVAGGAGSALSGAIQRHLPSGLGAIFAGLSRTPTPQPGTPSGAGALQTVFTPPGAFNQEMQLGVGADAAVVALIADTDRTPTRTETGYVTYVATNVGGSWVSAALPGSAATNNGSDRPAVTVGACGPVVAYDTPARQVGTSQVHVAVFRHGGWDAWPAGTVQGSNAPQFPGVAAVGYGLDLVSVADRSGTPWLTAAYVPCRAPVVASVRPDRGAQAGGAPVVLTGHGFTGATAVWFRSAGGRRAARFRVVSDTEIQATSPSGRGPVVVVVTNAAGSSAASGNGRDRFTYDTGTGGK